MLLGFPGRDALAGKRPTDAGKPFNLREFMDRFNGVGMIPPLLMEDEMVSNNARLPQ